jgi:hypothetical protein
MIFVYGASWEMSSKARFIIEDNTTLVAWVVSLVFIIGEFPLLSNTPS